MLGKYFITKEVDFVGGGGGGVNIGYSSGDVSLQLLSVGYRELFISYLNKQPNVMIPN